MCVCVCVCAFFVLLSMCCFLIVWWPEMLKILDGLANKGNIYAHTVGVRIICSHSS